MKAILFPGDRTAVLSDVAEPQAGPGEVRVRMVATGICGTDMHRFRYSADVRAPEAGFVTGHEAVGIVDQVGEGVTGPAVGSRVVVWHIWPCTQPGGPCPDSVASGGLWCPHGPIMGATANGANGDWQVVPAHCAMPLPDSYTPAQGFVLACNYGTAWRAVIAGGVKAGDRVTIWGLGPVGLCAVQIARLLGADVVGVDLSEVRRGFAATLGATTADPSAFDDELAEQRYDVSIDTTGQSSVQMRLLEIAHHRGTVVLVGLSPHTGITATRNITLKELTVRGSLVYARDEWEQLLAFVESTHADIDALVSHTFDVEQPDIDTAYALADAGEASKIVFRWRESW